MMKPSYYTWRQMHLESDLELPYHKTEVVQPAQETKHHTTAYSHLSHLQAIACQVQKEDKTTLKERGTRYTTRASEVPSILLCERGEYDNRSQMASSNFQERCSNAISENTLNSPQNTTVQSKNHIKTWTRSIHSTLALKTKLQGKQIQRNTWHAV